MKYDYCNGDFLSAKTLLSTRQTIIFILLFIVIASALLAKGKFFLSLFLIIINLGYFLFNTYRLIIFLISMKINKEREGSEFIDKDNDNELPYYTILVALFKEDRIVPQLIAKLQEIDYPQAKLQIIIILEAEDSKTIEALSNAGLPCYIKVLIIPFSFPQTKAKACNEALKLATGKIVCIYDAEDWPDSLQLRKVVNKFKNSPANTVCVQCKLRYYNHSYNWLTNMFEIEYQGLFNYILPFACYFNYPIPLSGSSNHIKLDFLKSIGGWDPYNVTEDADIGLKIAISGHKTVVIFSATAEESPISFRAWTKQRIRWIKGYFHTFFIYTRRPILTLKSFTITGLIFFIYMFMGQFLLLSIPFNTVLGYTLTRIEGYSFFVKYIFNLFLYFNLIYGLFVTVIISYIVKKHNLVSNIKYFWSYPLYTILHVFASFLAFYRMISALHKWEKTEHGITFINE